MDHGNTQDPTPPAGDNQDIHHKIGHLTRQLHDALKELGYADQLAATVGELPDAQSRLSYIARLTGDAAEKVLNRVDQAKSHNDNLAAEVREVIAAMVKNPVAAVATGRIMNFLRDVERATQTTDEHLTEIMMAQDFQDLTGQVIKRLVELTRTLETQLLQVLIEAAPVQALEPEQAIGLLNGPVIDPDGRGDVVQDQAQVDELLERLGF